MLEEFWLAVQEGLLTTYQAFQELPPIKRILLIIFVVSIIPGYFLTRTVSRLYWQHNYQQYQVTAHPSFTDPRPISQQTVRVLPSGTGSYSAFVRLHNENLDLSARSFRYTFTFYNDSNEAVHTTVGQSFLLPNQSKYLIVARFSTTETIRRGTVELRDTVWQKRLSLADVDLRTPKPEVYNELNPIAFVVQGDLFNQSPYALGAVRLTFILYDSNNVIIGVSQRDEFHVRAAERRTYKLSWPGIYTTSVAKVEVIPETNALDNANLVSQSQQIPPTNLSRPQLQR